VLHLAKHSKATSMSSHGCLKFVGPKKLLIFSVNSVLCYVPQCAILQGNAQVFGKNIDKNKVEVRVGISNIFFPMLLKSSTNCNLVLYET
jgi:hypothetical protein